jgi:hypothetical protein
MYHLRLQSVNLHFAHGEYSWVSYGPQNELCYSSQSGVSEDQLAGQTMAWLGRRSGSGTTVGTLVLFSCLFVYL